MRKKKRYEQAKSVKIEERKKGKGRCNVKELKRNKIFQC